MDLVILGLNLREFEKFKWNLEKLDWGWGIVILKEPSLSSRADSRSEIQREGLGEETAQWPSFVTSVSANLDVQVEWDRSGLDRMLKEAWMSSFKADRCQVLQAIWSFHSGGHGAFSSRVPV